MNINITDILKIALPFIIELIKSKAVPAIKRIAYEKLDKKADDLYIKTNHFDCIVNIAE